MARAKDDVSFETLMIIKGLQQGDEIEVKNGGVTEIHEVRKVKRVNIETTHNGQNYDVPFVLFVKIHKKIDAATRAAAKNEKLKEQRQEIRTLKHGEPFWYNDGKKACLLYFKELKPGKIVGTSPVENLQWTIPETMYGGRVEFPVAQKKAQ